MEVVIHLISKIVAVILAVICTEAITQLVVHSEMFRPLREFAEFSDFTETLVSCGYCFSVWAALLCSYWMAPLAFPTSYWAINWIIWTLVIHRLSNFLDDFADRYLEGPYIMNQNPFANADEHFGIVHDETNVSNIEIDTEEE